MFTKCTPIRISVDAVMATGELGGFLLRLFLFINTIQRVITIRLFLFYRDRLTKDDCIGTVHVPLSRISGQGGDGKEEVLSEIPNCL